MLDPRSFLATVQIATIDRIEQRKHETQKSKDEQQHDSPFVDNIATHITIVERCREDNGRLHHHDSNRHAKTNIHPYIVSNIFGTYAVVDQLAVMIEFLSASLAIQAVLRCFFDENVTNRALFCLYLNTLLTLNG